MMTIEQYLEKVSLHCDNQFGKLIRNNFKDTHGSSELGMLASPSSDELGQLKKAVAIMTEAEKEQVESLGDEQIQKIASDAQIDAGIFAIFVNGYCLECKNDNL